MKPAPEVTTASLLAAEPVRGLSLSRPGLQTHICDDGKLFVTRAAEKLTAFVELESTNRLAGNLY